jgi:uncharacterized protein YkwD
LTTASTLRRLVLALALSLLLAACSAGGLAPGLTARLDHPGASVNRADALAIINHYRQSVGAPVLIADAGLDVAAQDLARQYAATGKQQPKPAGAQETRYSAGYVTFAETFSGWRNVPADAKAMGNAAATRAGIGAVYAANSPYGAYWVLVLG